MKGSGAWIEGGRPHGDRAVTLPIRPAVLHSTDHPFCPVSAPVKSRPNVIHIPGPHAPNSPLSTLARPGWLLVTDENSAFLRALDLGVQRTTAAPGMAGMGCKGAMGCGGGIGCMG